MKKKNKEFEEYIELEKNADWGFIIDSEEDSRSKKKFFKAKKNKAEQLSEYENIQSEIKEAENSEDLKDNLSENEIMQNSELKKSEKAENLKDKKQNRFINLIKSKKFIITGSVVLAAAVVFVSAWLFISSLWKNCDMVMPAFFADMGLYQGKGFRFYKGITVNDVDVAGLSLEEAKEQVENSLNKNTSDISIDISAGENSFVLSSDEIIYEIDGESALNEAKSFCIDVMRGNIEKQNKNFFVPLKLTQNAEEKIKSKAKSNIHKEPLDASFNGVSRGKVNFTDEVSGYTVNEEELIKNVSEFLLSGKTNGKITVSTVEIPAKITKAMLKEKITLLATHSTFSTTTPEGNHNMKKALDMCNGSVIKPGAVWSFNACTGNSNIEANGWKKSIVYANGRQTLGVGGGLCQASTTIYNAALYANLGIRERHCHIWAASYAKEGFDATIDYPNLDLKLKNNTDYPIYIECYMTGKKLTANFYGYHTDNYDKITLNSYETQRVDGEFYRMASNRSLWKDGKLVLNQGLPSSRYSLKPKLWEGEEEPKPEQPDPEIPDPEIPDPENPDPENPDPEKPDPEKPDPEKPDPENPDPENPDPENPDPENPGGNEGGESQSGSGQEENNGETNNNHEDSEGGNTPSSQES